MPKYELPELPYDYSALEPHYSAEMLELHHDKHHKAYVDGANTTFEKLGEARESGDFGTINQLEKNMAFHLSGHVLHSLFWKNMSPDGGGEPDGDLAAAVKECFGVLRRVPGPAHRGRDRTCRDRAGVRSRGSRSAGRLIVEQVYDHQGNVGQGGPPLLVLDMWEHAYYLQYKNVKKDWVDAYWHLVNWPDVATRFERVRSLHLV